jgi:hypothetical protein
MPRPFYKTGLTYDQSALDALAKRPKLAMHAGVVVSMWAYIEFLLAHLLGVMLQADRHIATLIYMQIKSEPARLAVMQAIAAERLTPTLLAEFMQLKKRVSQTGSQRDRIAHALWAVPYENPDSIAMEDPRHICMLWATLGSIGLKGKKRNRRALTQVQSAMRKVEDSTYEYQEQDFVGIEDAIRKLADEIEDFTTKVWSLFPRRRASHPTQPKVRRSRRGSKTSS